jgi:hypothetical protein
VRVNLAVDSEVIVCFVEWMVCWGEGSDYLYTERREGQEG